MRKYVFSSTLEDAGWDNSTIVRGDVAAETAKLKQQEGRDLLIWGHGLLAQTLLTQHLVDVLDISIYPVLAGHGKMFFREGQDGDLRLVTAKTFSKGIVKLTYEPTR
jgi:dihydrofolate reductase